MEYKWRAIYIDMVRIINALSAKELKECELTCNRVSKKEKTLKLGLLGNKGVITENVITKYLKRVFVLCAKNLISFKLISHLGYRHENI